MTRFPRLRPQTLTGRLAIGGIAWIGTWAVALLLTFNVLLSNVLAGQVDAALRARAQAVATTVRVSDGKVHVRVGADDDALDAGTSIYEGDLLVEGTDLSPRLRDELVQRGERTSDREALGPVRYVAEPIRSHGRQVGTIVVSSDIGARSRTLRIIALASVLLIGMMLLFTFFALRATIERAMRPVRVMGEQASAWSDRDIDRRFDPSAGPLELQSLAITLNALLERISAALRHERNFTAELSHELRTPLAHLHAEVDLLSASAGDPRSREPVSEHDLSGLLTSIRRLEALVETSLVPARAGQLAGPGLGNVDDALDGIRPPTGSNARLRVVGDSHATLAVESDIVRRALIPVVENAFRYAQDEVTIDVREGQGMTSVTISDDGGQLDPDLAERIFEPGFRAVPGDRHPGAGLGLALTRRICRSVGGDATASVLDGRTTMTLTFPSV